MRDNISEELRQIDNGLEEIADTIRSGTFKWSALEDVHMNIEGELVNRIGELEKNYTRPDLEMTKSLLTYASFGDKTDESVEELKDLVRAIVQLAHKESATLMPGYTHLQVAQPVTFGHHLLAWAEMILNVSRFKHRSRINILPLGSGALAGTTFPIIVASLQKF